MRKILFLCFSYVLFFLPSSVAISQEDATVDYNVVIINMNQKINNLIKELDDSQNDIELLQESLRVAEQKITEIFKTLEFNIVDEAISTEIKKRKDNEEEAYLHYSNARNNLKLRFYDEAIDLLTIYIEKYENQKNYIDAHYWLATALYHKGSYDEAEQLFIKFQKENPLHAKYPYSIYDLAQILIKLSRIQEAKQMLHKILDKFPTHSLSIKASSKIKELEEITIIEN